MLKNALFVVLIFFVIKTNAQQGFKISGVVTDEKDNPIPGATVFLGDSQKAAATNSAGEFVLERVQPGNYLLVIKMIGYVVLRHDMMLQGNTRFRFKLVEDNTELKTVEISAMSWADRKRHLATFIRCFFGMSANAAQCRILNTDDIKLRFNKKEDVLTARSDEFLIIENRALGYKMMYLLNDFSFERPYEDGGIISFSGTTYFEDLKGSERQQKRWELERINTYFGSLTHFFRSLFTNSLNENGFTTYLIPNPSALKNMIKLRPERVYRYLNPVKNFDKFITGIDSNDKRFDLGSIKKDSTELYVLYTPKNESEDFLKSGKMVERFKHMPPGQLSIARPVGDSILISRNGNYGPVNGNSILLIGFWEWYAASGFLPVDYTLPPGTVVPERKKKWKL